MSILAKILHERHFMSLLKSKRKLLLGQLSKDSNVNVVTPSRHLHYSPQRAGANLHIPFNRSLNPFISSLIFTSRIFA